MQTQTHINDVIDQRYFVLFPLVGDSAEGLVKYGRFLASEIASGAETRLKQKIGGDEISFVSLVSKLVEETVSVTTLSDALTSMCSQGG